MGLDAYFYKHTKVKECDTVNYNNWVDIVCDNSGLKEQLEKLAAIARRKGVSLNEILSEAITSYLDHNNEGHLCEVMYFRQCYFLNDYFHYTDEWYDVDMTVTKDQCTELRDKAKECLDEISKICKEKGVTICCYNYGTNTYTTQSHGDVDFVDDIIYKYFPSERKPKGVDLYSKILCLHRGMNDLIHETDWYNEEIVYNADW